MDSNKGKEKKVKIPDALRRKEPQGQRRVAVMQTLKVGSIVIRSLSLLEVYAKKIAHEEKSRTMARKNAISQLKMKSARSQ